MATAEPAIARMCSTAQSSAATTTTTTSSHLTPPLVRGCTSPTLSHPPSTILVCLPPPAGLRPRFYPTLCALDPAFPHPLPSLHLEISIIHFTQQVIAGNSGVIRLLSYNTASLRNRMSHDFSPFRPE